MIKGDINNFFGDIRFKVLYSLISRYVGDRGFESLIRKFYKASFTVNKYRKVSGGILLGSPLRPLLVNITLHELDVFVNRAMVEVDSEYRRPPVNPGHTCLNRKESESLEKIREDHIVAINNRIGFYAYNEARVLVKYVRYADDFIIGVSGSFKLASEVKSKVIKFLSRELRLQSFGEKIRIRNIIKERTIFLGAWIFKIPRNKLPYKDVKVRTSNIQISVPVKRLIDKLTADGIGRKLSGGGWKPSRVGRLTHLRDAMIVDYFSTKWCGLWNYYKACDNASRIVHVLYLLKYSCA